MRSSRWRFLLVYVALSGGLLAAERPWVKVTVDRFTILTTEKEDTARKWALELEQFHLGLQAIVPVPVERLAPVTMVLFKDAAAMRPYVPLENGRPENIGGLFVRTNDLNTIMVSLAGDTRETRRLIFHEAVHWHLSALEVQMPLWLDEGLAELFATFQQPDAKHYEVGALLPRYASLLRSGKLLPLAQLVATDRSSLLYNEGNKANMFYAQSWAFAHFLFFGDGAKGSADVARFLALLKPGVAPAAAFEATWGRDYAAVESRLVRYIRSGVFEKATHPAALNARSALAVGTATRAEIELAKGALLFGSHDPAAAEPHIRTALELEPNEIRAWELLGYIAFDRQDFKAANAALTRAATGGSKNAFVYYNLGVSRQAGTADPASASGQLDPKLMDLAAADFRHAIELMPTYVVSYEALAGLAYGMATFRAEDIELLTRGLAMAPGNAMIEAGIAAGEIRLGQREVARSRLARIIARDPARTATGTRFAQMIAESETLQVEIQEASRLIGEKNFTEAIAIVDRALARPLQPQHRPAMLSLRRRLMDFKAIASATDLANAGDSAAAKRMLAEVVASVPEKDVVEEALRVMGELMRATAPER